MLVTLAMVAVALFLAGWATHAALKSFLIDRVDRDLTSQQLPQLRAGSAVSGRLRGDSGHERGESSGFRSRTIAEVRYASGQVIRDVPSDDDDDAELPDVHRARLLHGRPGPPTPGSTGCWR